jgi:hypothetical protein
LTKKTRGVITTTESVFSLKGLETAELYNENLFNQIQKAGKISDWAVFVTTPEGALQIGFDRLISDMKKLKAWLYIIDPIKKNVIGVQKGSKSKIRDTDLMEKYNQNLPQQPYRVPNQIRKLSKYNFNEKNAYKIKNIGKYSLEPHFLNESPTSIEIKPGKYSDIFQSLLIIEKGSGIALYSHSNKNKNQISDIVISGFLTAVDSFGTTISGSSGLEEINYKGFIITVRPGQLIKTIAILSTSPTEAFKERLKVFTSDFEKKYHAQIIEFAQTGAVIQDETILPFIQRLLAI